MVKVLVVGDLMIDAYIWGSCDRISPEAPVQVVKIENETKRLGGAGNVVSNLIALGASVGVVSVVGDDLSGDEICDLLTKRGAKIELVLREKERKSAVKTRVMATHQQILRIDSETAQNTALEDEIIAKFDDILQDYDIVLLSDYGKGILTHKICQNIIKSCKLAKKMVLIDPKGSDYSKYKGATLLTPNKKEASLAVGFDINSDESLKKAIKALKYEFDLEYSLITISEDGIALYNGEFEIFPALAKEVFDVTGAGDSVLATLGYCLGSKQNIKDAIKTANLAAAVVVGKVGSADATFDEIQALTTGGFMRKIKSLDEITQISQNRGKNRLIFTNGCFDILHLGHIEYLQKARSFGDMLIVGLNSDRSIKALKGETRPVNGELDRASLLAALEFVDFVVIFDEDTPLNLIKAIKPDILVKGADYKGKEVVGSEICEVKLVDFVDGKSTTKIIERIKC